MTRRGVLYGRVSKHHGQGDAKSVDQQLDILLAQAAREGVQVVGPFRDDGVSASRYAGGKARAGWTQTMQAITGGRVDELWTWEISRATRDRPVWAKLISACLAHDVVINVGGKVHDPADPDDGFMLDLMAALAVRESAATSKRIKRDVEARAAQGLPHGKIPFGFRREYHPVTRALIAQVPDPPTAAIVREMTVRLLRGESMYAIAADLNLRNIPSPQTVREIRMRGDQSHHTPWRGDEVRGQVLSPTLAGLRTHNGVIVGAASWPALISLDERAELLALLNAPGRQKWFGPAKHLLSGIAECGVCGTRLRAGFNRTYPAYMCPGPDRRGRACVCRVREPLDAHVIWEVVQRLEDPGLLAHLARSKSADAAAVETARRELAVLDARRGELEEKAATGEISLSMAGRLEARLLTDTEAARAQLSSLAAVDPVLAQAAGPGAGLRWNEHADAIDWQRRVVRALVRVVVHRSRRPRGAKGFDPDAVEILDA